MNTDDDFAFPVLTAEQIGWLTDAMNRLAECRAGMRKGQFVRLISSVAAGIVVDDKLRRADAPALAAAMGQLVLLEMLTPSLRPVMREWTKH